MRRWQHRHLVVRIVPARAGFTQPVRAACASSLDHPRSRGVYTALVDVPEDHRGSSPLARGLQKVVPPTGTPPGIIPARAGFTLGHSYTGRNKCGSSPLARGLPMPSVVSQSDAGIIPARAGFTRRRCSHSWWVPDHPRSRGVYMAGERVDIDARGSSPLARGLPRLAVLLQRPAGIIPARAGFTPEQHRHRTRSRDHPRSRGVYLFRP